MAQNKKRAVPRDATSEDGRIGAKPIILPRLYGKEDELSMGFTPAELAEMARADAEIEADFCMTNEEIAFGRILDRDFTLENMDRRSRKIAEYQRQYRAANKDKIAEYQRQYRAANKDKIAEYKRQYRAANKDKYAEYQRQYYAANKDKYAEYQRQYRAANKDT